MKASLDQLRPFLPGPGQAGQTAGLPDETTTGRKAGAFDVQAFAHGTMSLEVLAPRGETEPAARLQDGVYIVISGTSTVSREDGDMALAAGDAAFVKARAAHRFTGMSDDFTVWYVAYGPSGGEAPAPDPSVFASIDA